MRPFPSINSWGASFLGNGQASIHWSQWPKQIQIYTDLLEKNNYHVGHTGKGWGPGPYKHVRQHNPAGKAWNSKKLKAPTKNISTTDYTENFKDFLAAKKDDQPFCFWYGAKEPHRRYTKDSGSKIRLRSQICSRPKILPRRSHHSQ